jgi:hypothetical protein
MEMHVQVYVNLGFWKPCVYASNITAEQAAELQGAEAVLATVLPIIGNVITINVVPVPATAPTTLSDVDTTS